MLDYLTAFSLMLLIVTNGMLVRGCFRIREAIPVEGNMIAGKIDRTSELIDELCQLISDFADSSTNTAVAQTPSGVGDLLSMFLNNRMNMANEHGKTQEWEIHQTDNDPPQTEEQGIEHHQHG